MSISRYIDRSRVMFLRNKTKKGALSELCGVMAKHVPGVGKNAILSAVLEREELLTTKIAPGIAIPHARIPGMEKTLIAVGKSAGGVTYDAKDDSKVRLIFMIIGDDNTHLRALGEVAGLFQDPDFLERALKTNNKRDFFNLLTGATAKERRIRTVKISRAVSEQALQLANLINAAAVIVHDPPDSIKERLLAGAGNVRMVFASSAKQGEPENGGQDASQLIVPFRGLNRSSHIEISLLLALSKGLVKKNEKVISVFGMSSASTLDTIAVTDIDKEFKMFFSMPLDGSHGNTEQPVFIRALQLATELAAEGREGKAAGALFVLGDYKNVYQHCHQMVINPFKGYDEHERNILDPGLTETIKELARIDGAFIIRGNGVIASAGTYLRIDHPVKNLPSGLGARHAAAAGITATTSALSVAVSESTRKISLFKSGERVMEV